MAPDEVLRLALAVLAFIWGAAVGSFLDCAASRLVRGGKLTGRSHCDSCGETLSARDLIPVTSWLLLRGRCRHCGAPVGIRCLITELSTAAAFTLIFLVYGMSWDTVRYMVMASALLPAALCDLDTEEIPDRFWIIIAADWLVFLFLREGLTLKYALAGLCSGLGLGFFFLLMALLMEKILKKEALGGGDIKLFAALGLHFGVMRSVFLVIVTCFAGIVMMLAFNKRENGMPLAPAIALGAVVTVLLGTPAASAYAGMLGIPVI